MFLCSSVIINLSVLGFFKYADFLIGTVNGLFHTGLRPLGLGLPVGISFFTFQTMSYSIDLYRRKVPVEKNYLTYLTYVSMFPQLVAGPIVRFSTVNQELHSRKIRRSEVTDGFYRFLQGLFKKVLIANQAGALWEEIRRLETGQASAATAWLGAVAFTLQLYFDFSGYCDMAMGISRMFNLELPLNFNSPYKALSPVEFWKRWHMTLTRFLRTYIYFPLGGSRKGSLRTYMNIMIVFLVSGFWHGAAWTFILWGALHGAAQALNRVFKRQWENLHTAFRWMATFLFVNLTWVIFRSESISQAKLFLKRLLDFGNMQINPSFMDSFKMVELPLWLTGHRVFTVLGLYGIVLCLVMNARNMGETELRPTFLRGAGTALLLVWSVLSLAGISGFIYFQF